jgi:hypothetical protein
MAGFQWPDSVRDVRAARSSAATIFSLQIVNVREALTREAMLRRPPVPVERQRLESLIEDAGAPPLPAPRAGSCSGMSSAARSIGPIPSLRVAMTKN